MLFVSAIRAFVVNDAAGEWLGHESSLIALIAIEIGHLRMPNLVARLVSLQCSPVLEAEAVGRARLLLAG